MNVGGTVGDDPQRVLENRRRCFHEVRRDPLSVFDVWQVHTTDVICTDRPRMPEEKHQKADIIFTDRPEITLFMRFGDCVPVLLVDPKRRVAGLVHAGWPGTVKKATMVAVETMTARYGSSPADIHAAIGPSICVEHYPVGADVIQQVHEAFDLDATALLPEINGQAHFDLWAANRLTLEQAGVRQIETAGLCTFHHNEDWFSHRAEKGKTGRFGALITLGGRSNPCKNSI